MIPRKLNLPEPGALKTEEVMTGVFVVKGAYSRKADYFSTSNLYSPKSPRTSSNDSGHSSDSTSPR